MAFKKLGDFSSSSEDEEMEGNKHYARAKLSKNTGATSQSKQILQARRIKEAQTGVLGDFDVQAKNHRLHRPMQATFDREQPAGLGKRDPDSLRSFQVSTDSRVNHGQSLPEGSETEQQTEITNWISQFDKLASLLKLLKSSIFVCMVCNLKFPSYKTYNQHVTEGQLHQTNLSALEQRILQKNNDLDSVDEEDIPLPDGPPPIPKEGFYEVPLLQGVKAFTGAHTTSGQSSLPE